MKPSLDGRCSWVWDDGGRRKSKIVRSGRRKNEVADCVTRAIAIATRKPYDEVHVALTANRVRHVYEGDSKPWTRHARRRGGVCAFDPDHGCHEGAYAPYLNSLGWRFISTKGQKVRLRSDELPRGRLIVDVARHLVAVIDHEIRDMHDSGLKGRRPVKGYWIAEQKEFQMTREFHPLANIFPLMEGAEFLELAADIKANGLHETIVVFEDKILDGRNRYRACMAADVEPRFSAYTGIDPIDYVISLNLKRRHLDESQRAMVAAKLATLKRGDNQHSPIGETSQAKAAELLNVGKRSVERAAEVRDHGAPELVSAVEQGNVSVSAAAVIAGQSIEEQRQILALVEPRLIVKEAQKINAIKAKERHDERIAKLVAISNNSSPLPADRQYPVIYADPPWQFRQGISSPIRDTENHYPTMTTEAICALPVANLTTPDAVLFLWTTTAHLPEALRVMTAWGFEYQTNMVWIKDWIGPGYWVRGRHELLLIGTRGDMPHPSPSARPDSVIEAPRREHSRKPDEAYALIGAMYPELPKIELFARHARAGWDVWGNEAPIPKTAQNPS